MENRYIEWRGERWYLNKGGYFQNRKGRLYHRELYQHHHGEIGAVVDIHHRDEDKSNNDIANLVALSRGQHLREHGPRGFQLWGTEERRRNTRENVWGKRQPRERLCSNCGAAFSSVGMRAKFCSPACKAADFRSRHPGYYRRERTTPK